MYTWNEDAGVVDQRVDAPEALQGGINHAPAGLWVRNIPTNCQIGWIGARSHRSRRANNTVVALAMRIDSGFSETSRRTSNDNNLLVRAHDFPRLDLCCIQRRGLW
jgi:hypothetical protein